ncbi:ABC transporter permease [Rhabdaerophilum calidifontis]|uniref:ABC transporter permease n=1 Tax=Rhabdaerophilum calidifontis TaxID=2604328 RepID=UPI001238E3AA|nr:ABC transporter permease [Rhabdaerophilum calidifontis]
MSPATSLPRWADVVLLPALNVALAFLAAGLVVLAIGENPLEATALLLRGALGHAEGLGFTLYYATNFVFTGLAVAVAFHAGLFNIGGEGQAMLGGIGAAAAALALGHLPGAVALPAAILAAALCGAGWAAVPGWLQARRGSHVVITTIMFNFIASALLVYLLVDVLRPEGMMEPSSRGFASGARLPFIHEAVAPLGLALPKTPLNLAFPLALLAALLVWLLIYRSRLGYAIRIVGANPEAARYAGISPAKITVLAMAISGALAGMMAVNEILGVQHRLLLAFTAGYGFVGIAVALMGRGHPAGIVLAALLFGVLYQGGTELAFDKPNISRDMIVVIQGLVVLFAGALEFMLRPALARVLQRRRRG